jgi:hypothetical protein
MEPTCGLELEGVALSARDCGEVVRLNLILLTIGALGFALALAARWSPLRHYRLRLVRRKADRDGDGG